MIVNKNVLLDITLWTIVFVIMHSLSLLKTVIWSFPVLMIVKVYATELIKDIRRMLKDADDGFRMNSPMLNYNYNFRLDSAAPNNRQPDTTTPNNEIVESNVRSDLMTPNDAGKKIQTDEDSLTLKYEDFQTQSTLTSEPNFVEDSTISGTPNAPKMTRKKGQSGIPIRCTVAKVTRKERKSKIPVRAAIFKQIVFRRLSLKEKLIHLEDLMDSIGQKNIYRDDLRYHCLYNQLRIEFNLIVDML